MPDDLTQYVMVPRDALNTQMDELKAQKAQVAEAMSRLEAVQQRVTQDREAAEAALAEVERREAKLKTDTEALAATIEHHNGEKAAFEAVRQKVDADHQAREAALTSGERKLAEDRNQVEAHRADLNQREADVSDRESAHGRRAAALRQALEID
jgi:chromosome segregation ATPase